MTRCARCREPFDHRGLQVLYEAGGTSYMCPPCAREIHGQRAQAEAVGALITLAACGVGAVGMLGLLGPVVFIYFCCRG
jgi:hypothetical protein